MPISTSNKAAKIIGVITARMASTRLPGKVLKLLGPKSIFEHHVERMKNVQGLDGVFLATSNDPQNKALIEEAKRLGCGWYVGAEQDIVDRHIGLCQQEGADAFIRVTCDSPIFDIESTAQAVAEYRRDPQDYIYVSNMTMIQGTLTELVSLKAMRVVHEHYRGAAITAYIKENLSLFKTKALMIDQDLCRPEYRLTIDEAVDIEMIGRIYTALYKGKPLSLKEVYTWLDDNPKIARLNMNVGIKGCEQQSADLISQTLYYVVPSGKKFVILDEHKRLVDTSEFLKRFKNMFPQAMEETV